MLRPFLCDALAIAMIVSGGAAMSDDSKTDTPKKSEPPKKPEHPGKAVIGKPAYDFTVTAMDGKVVKMSELKGKVVLIDFWGPSCPNCLKAMPHVVDMSNKYKKEGLEVLSVYPGMPGTQGTADKEKLKIVLAKYKMDFSVLYLTGLDLAGFLKNYNIRGVPHVVVIDRKGINRAVKIGGNELLGKDKEKALEEMIEKLLAEKE